MGRTATHGLLPRGRRPLYTGSSYPSERSAKVLCMASYDLAIIGAGPGGYVAAIRGAQLGLKTVCIERDAVGGVCLNWGCIPSKSLIRNAEVLRLVRSAGDFGITTGDVSADYGAALKRSRGVVDRLGKGIMGLFRKHGVTLLQGEATLLGGRTIAVGGERIEASNVIVATGSRPAAMPGVEVDGKVVLTYREAVMSETAPLRAAIIGGGAAGLEFAYIYNAYGAHVTVVEMESRILPKEDAEISAALTRSLKKQGIDVLTGSKVTAIERSAEGATVSVETPEGAVSLETDRVLVSIGIRPNTDGLGLEDAGATLERGFVRVDGELRANADGLFAIGDVVGTLPLAHVAQAEGAQVAERIAGQEVRPLDYQAMPRAVYTNPQVASMGLSEEEAVAQGHEIKVGKFPFLASGRALAAGASEGFAKVVVDASTGELLGAHLIGHEVTELLGELSLARIMEGTAFDVGSVVNAHPTLSEAVKEAAMAAVGHAIHV